eukprot:768732-Hanusia_phi.AAC.6
MPYPQSSSRQREQRISRFLFIKDTLTSDQLAMGISSLPPYARHVTTSQSGMSPLGSLVLKTRCKAMCKPCHTAAKTGGCSTTRTTRGTACST